MTRGDCCALMAKDPLPEDIAREFQRPWADIQFLTCMCVGDVPCDWTSRSHVPCRL